MKKAITDGISTFNAMTIATIMFACSSVDSKGKLVLPTAGAEVRPHQEIHKRINSKYGHYIIFAKEVNSALLFPFLCICTDPFSLITVSQIGLDFTKPGFFSVATLARIATLGIDFETSLKDIKKILRSHVETEKSLELDTMDIAPPVQARQAPPSTSVLKTKGSSRKRPATEGEDEDEGEEEEEAPKKKKSKGKGRTLASGGGKTKHGAMIRTSL